MTILLWLVVLFIAEVVLTPAAPSLAVCKLLKESVENLMEISFRFLVYTLASKGAFMKISAVSAFIIFSVFTSCARHSVMRGSVAMKVSEDEAHVCFNKDEVKEGDRVTAFYNDCTRRTLGDSRGATPCVKSKLGQGTIEEILNEHYSRVKFDSGVKVSEGMFVEKN